MGRGSMIDLADRGIESPYATEPRSQGDFIHWESGLVNELFGKVQTPGVTYSTGRCSQVAQEQTAKMARANSQALCETFDSPVVECALINEPQCARNCVRSS